MSIVAFVAVAVVIVAFASYTSWANKHVKAFYNGSWTIYVALISVFLYNGSLYVILIDVLFILLIFIVFIRVDDERLFIYKNLLIFSLIFILFYLCSRTFDINQSTEQIYQTSNYVLA